jgi:putative sigma-54 modulation protein
MASFSSILAGGSGLGTAFPPASRRVSPVLPGANDRRRHPGPARAVPKANPTLLTRTTGPHERSYQVNVNITGRHVEITQPLRDYVVEKVERLTRFFDRISRMQVTLNVEGERHIAEMILSANRGVTLIGEEVAGDMYSAVDLVVDKLGRQLKKHKGKLRGPRRGGNRRDASVTYVTKDGREGDLLSYQEAIDEGM